MTKRDKHIKKKKERAGDKIKKMNSQCKIILASELKITSEAKRNPYNRGQFSVKLLTC